MSASKSVPVVFDHLMYQKVLTLLIFKWAKYLLMYLKYMNSICICISNTLQKTTTVFVYVFVFLFPPNICNCIHVYDPKCVVLTIAYYTFLNTGTFII